jgi:hypothetical protein
MDDSFTAGVQISEKLGKYLASDTVGEGLHDELDILALVGGSEQIEVIARHAETGADGIEGSAGLYGR